MDKKALKKELIRFRDLLKDYQSAVQAMWRERRRYQFSDEIEKIRTEQETPLRETVTELFGKLEKYLRKMGVPMHAVWYGRTMPIFDTALDAKIFDNPGKGETLNMAVQMAIKAMGMVDSMDEDDVEHLDRRTPVVFVAHNFAGQNESLVATVVAFLESQNVAVIVGSEPSTDSVSEKVKGKINDSDIVLGIMSKDEEAADGTWSASKWIRDELAYALGTSEKAVIRMIEDGCDSEGRIFGDREYIPFDRGDLSPALIKLAVVLRKHTR